MNNAASIPEQPTLNAFTAAVALKSHWAAILVSAVMAGVIGYCISYLVTPLFVATNTFMPPQQQNTSSLATLGALSGLVGPIAARNSADQYVSLMQSVTVSDRLIQKLDLLSVYDTKYKEVARKKLLRAARMTVGKKDGLIQIEVEDKDAVRAAAIANQYVEELRSLTSKLAVTEAQQRRVFFEKLLTETKENLAKAQFSLEGSGITTGVLKAEPKSAADGYAKLRASLTEATVRLQVMRGRLAEGSPEVLQQESMIAALAGQLRNLENNRNPGKEQGADYTNKYREYKYQETLFDLFAKQYEIARIDESREGALIQVIDEARPAERKSSPSRAKFLAIGTLFGLLAASGIVFSRQYFVPNIKAGIS